MVYKKGALNGAADALSRKPVDSSQVFSVSIVQPLWLESVQESYDKVEAAKELISKLAIDPKADANYTQQWLIEV